MPRVAIVILGFVLSGLVGLGAYFLPVFQTAAKASPISAGLPNLNPVQAPTAPFTVLLLGSDDDSKFVPDQLNTQSMILIRVDPVSKQATMLSIPRDLWVSIPNHGMGKIDWAYRFDGPQGAIAVVESNFKVHVDDYVWIGLKGLIKIIDLVGGVDVPTSNPVMDDYYPADINTSNAYGYYRVAVLPGPQHLDGPRALEYVRSRHSDLRQDFGRSARQQQVLLALRDRARHVNPADLPAFANALQGEFKTSLTLPQMAALLPAAERIRPTDVRQIVLLGDYTGGAVINGQDVLLPNWSLILPLVRETFP